MTPAQVASVISEVLERDDVAVGDNFFEIGGNSFLALTLLSELRKTAGAQLSLLDVVRFPTAAGLAQIAQSAQSAGQS